MVMQVITFVVCLSVRVCHTLVLYSNSSSDQADIIDSLDTIFYLNNKNSTRSLFTKLHLFGCDCFLIGLACKMLQLVV